MKVLKTLIIISTIVFFTSCKNKPDTIDSKKIELTTEIKSIKKRILKENSFGKLKLVKGMSLTEKGLKEIFPNDSISKNIGEQDGPNYFFYTIGVEAVLKTPTTENETLSELQIQEKSTVADVYGVKIGMTYADLKERRSNLTISTEHFHIYLSKEGSNIHYEMAIPESNGPDKSEYTFEDLKKSKVISIIWK